MNCMGTTLLVTQKRNEPGASDLCNPEEIVAVRLDELNSSQVLIEFIIGEAAETYQLVGQLTDGSCEQEFLTFADTNDTALPCENINVSRRLIRESSELIHSDLQADVPALCSEERPDSTVKIQSSAPIDCDRCIFSFARYRSTPFRRRLHNIP